MAVSIPHRHKRAKATMVSDNRVTSPAAPKRGARGWRRGLAGQRADAPSHRSATTPHRCGGRRRPWLRRPWAVAGPGRASRHGAEGIGGPGCGARGRWRGLAGLRGDAPSHRSATGPHWCGGHRRDWRAWLRRPWAVAGPGRASRSTTPSRRLACGDLAGGPPPTGAPSSPARQRIQKRPPETGWAYLSRLWESNPRPIHYE